MLLTIIITSAITSLIVSFIWGKWFMFYLGKSMDTLLDEQLKIIKEQFKNF